MKIPSCYLMAVSILLFACGESSEDNGTAGTGGASSTDGSGGNGTGGAEATGSGGSAASTSGGSGGAAPTATGSGVEAASLVIDLSDSDLEKVCTWAEPVLGLTPGAIPEEEYAGTWGIEECPPANESVFLWGSPALCKTWLPAGNTGACLELTVTRFEACMTAAGDDLCQVLHAAECEQFYECFQRVL